MFKKYITLFLFSFLGFHNSNAQINLSEYSEISFVIAGPGEELYEKFGHAAIRVKDPVLNLDFIYNYGIFDFNAPNFYTNFAQGKMYYLLAKYNFKYFLNSYKKDKRWVKQQVLNLNQFEKQDFFNYLENNALKENATYLYDPFFNNCATKLRDISSLVFKNAITYNTPKIPKNQSLRSLMNKELNWNSWGNFGINLIAGTILDTKRPQTDYMYLPDYVYLLFKNANKDSKKIILREDILLNFEEKKAPFSLFSPIVIFTILLLLVIGITIQNMKTKNRTKILDFTLFFITGFIGLILLYLWLFSSHKTAPNNFNILWAFVPNIYVAFIVLKSNAKQWVSKYIQLLIVLLFATLVLWIFGVQIFPITLIPVLILLLIRYVYLTKHLLTSVK
ncbi:DUF4105 domain-containing protein [uncultured Polaribacter sp.]|uniref:lipoprotein N-acyltransferase Lnb domain-containing protein n=1 Tax=uncultured Polaribacter sp. TaxID=174711 RepID=UPI0026161633|nr:DUF4105 domain-containing protein [uncultured Polaribacter sp.]